MSFWNYLHDSQKVNYSSPIWDPFSCITSTFPLLKQAQSHSKVICGRFMNHYTGLSFQTMFDALGSYLLQRLTELGFLYGCTVISKVLKITIN